MTTKQKREMIGLPKFLENRIAYMLEDIMGDEAYGYHDTPPCTELAHKIYIEVERILNEKE